MTRLVLDASFLVPYLLRPSESTTNLLSGSEMHVAFLCDVEFVSTLRRHILSKAISDDDAELALADYLDLPIERHSHAKLLRRVLALRKNFSAHDATHVALTEMLDATLLTADGKLARAAHAHTSIRVEMP